MKNLTIIVAVAISSMVVAQPGKGQDKGGHSEKNNKNESFGGHNKNDNQKHQGNKSQHDDQRNVYFADQGKKDHGGKGGHNGSGKQGDRDSYKGGHDRNGSSQSHKGNNKPVFHQDKGHGKNGGKSHKVNFPGHRDNNGKHYKGHEGNNKHFKGNKGNGHKGNGHNYGGKPGKVHYGKGHPNFGYVYVNQRGYYSGKNYGQWRSVQARNKHMHYHPIYEYQAVEGYNIIVVRNNFLFTETDYKINLLRIRLADRRKAGLITVVEYDKNIRTIEVIERRRAAIEVNVVI